MKEKIDFFNWYVKNKEQRKIYFQNGGNNG